MMFQLNRQDQPIIISTVKLVFNGHCWYKGKNNIKRQVTAYFKISRSGMVNNDLRITATRR
jgi:hypothetical protein